MHLSCISDKKQGEFPSVAKKFLFAMQSAKQLEDQGREICSITQAIFLKHWFGFLFLF